MLWSALGVTTGTMLDVSIGRHAAERARAVYCDRLGERVREIVYLPSVQRLPRMRHFIVQSNYVFRLINGLLIKEPV